MSGSERTVGDSPGKQPFRSPVQATVGTTSTEAGYSDAFGKWALWRVPGTCEAGSNRSTDNIANHGHSLLFRFRGQSDKFKD